MAANTIAGMPLGNTTGIGKGTARWAGPGCRRCPYQDDGAHGQLARLEQVDLFRLDQGNTLHPDDAEQVDRQAAGHGHRDRVDQRRQLADEAEQDGNHAGGHQAPAPSSCG